MQHRGGRLDGKIPASYDRRYSELALVALIAPHILEIADDHVGQFPQRIVDGLLFFSGLGGTVQHDRQAGIG